MGESGYVTEAELRAFRAPCGCAYPDGELVPCAEGKKLMDAAKQARQTTSRAYTKYDQAASKYRYFGPEFEQARREYEQQKQNEYPIKAAWDEHFEACGFPEVAYPDEPSSLFEPEYEEPSGAIEERAAEAAYYANGGYERDRDW